MATLHTAWRPGDVLMGDRAFCSFAHLALLHQQGFHAVFRVHQKQIVDCTPSRPHTTPKAPAMQKGLPRSLWLRQPDGMDQLVEWVKLDLNVMPFESDSDFSLLVQTIITCLGFRKPAAVDTL